MSKRNSRSKSDIVTFHGRYVLADGSATNVVPVPLTPLGLDARLLQVSDCFMEYRFTSLRATLTTSQNPTNPCRLLAVAYAETFTNTSPTTLVDCVESFGACAWGNGLFGSPCPDLRVPQKILRGGTNPWYRRSTGFDDNVEIQGRLFFAIDSTRSFESCPVTMVIEYTVELREPVAAGLSLARREQKSLDNDTVIVPSVPVKSGPPVKEPMRQAEGRVRNRGLYDPDTGRLVAESDYFVRASPDPSSVQ